MAAFPAQTPTALQLPPPGAGVGAAVGAGVGAAVGAGVGAAVGAGVGAAVGAGVGAAVGAGVGAAVGAGVGAGGLPPSPVMVISEQALKCSCCDGLHPRHPCPVTGSVPQLFPQM